MLITIPRLISREGYLAYEVDVTYVTVTCRTFLHGVETPKYNPILPNFQKRLHALGVSIIFLAELAL